MSLSLLKTIDIYPLYDNTEQLKQNISLNGSGFEVFTLILNGNY